MIKKLMVCGAIALGLTLAGCGTTTTKTPTAQRKTQVEHAIKASNATIAKMNGATSVKIVSAKEVANPYSADTKLKWPKTIVVVTYSGTFKTPIACPIKKKKCLPIVFTTATVVVNPTTDAILETVEPGWQTIPQPVVTPKPAVSTKSKSKTNTTPTPTKS